MKINLRIRFTALFLCLVMMLSVSCAKKADTTQPTSTPESSVTTGAPETPVDSDPATSESAEPEEGESDYPVNGATKVITKTVNLYIKSTSAVDFSVAHYIDRP